MKLASFCVLLMSAFLLVGISGCGGSGSNSVVEPSAENTESGIPPAQQQSYEDAMKNQPKR